MHKLRTYILRSSAKEIAQHQTVESKIAIVYVLIYEGNSISKLQIQVATYVFELSAGNCHR